MLSSARELVGKCPSDMMADDLSVRQWFALKVRTRSELGVVSVLESKGYTAFSPYSRERKAYCDRRKTVEHVLFPGYIFCQFDVTTLLPILTTPGVSHVVGIGKVPQPVSLTEIEALQRLMTIDTAAEPYPYLAIGQRVKVVSGGLAGTEGLLTTLKGAHRLIISVHLLQRSVAVEIDRGHVEALPMPWADRVPLN